MDLLGFYVLMFFAFLLLAHSQQYDDEEEEEYSASWQSVYFSESSGKEHEAIIRAMEQAFSGRTLSTEDSSSSCEDFTDSSSSHSEEEEVNEAIQGRSNTMRASLFRLEQTNIRKSRTKNLGSGFTDAIDTINTAASNVTSTKRRVVTGEDARSENGTPSSTSKSCKRQDLEYIPLSKSYHAKPQSSTEPVNNPSSPIVMNPRSSISPLGARTEARPTPAKSNPSTVTISPWVRRFLSKCPKDALLPVPRDFLVDNFNLVLLPEILSLNSTLFRQAWKMVVSVKDKNEDENQNDAAIETAATNLYLRLHQRFVLSHRGMDMVRRRLKVSPVFGRCPLPSCKGTPLLPIGWDNDAVAQRYCVKCRNHWMHWDSVVPGWAWGDSFCHLFVLEHGEEVFGTFKSETGTPCLHRVIPQIFGFQLHPSAKYG